MEEIADADGRDRTTRAATFARRGGPHLQPVPGAHDHPRARRRARRTRDSDARGLCDRAGRSLRRRSPRSKESGSPPIRSPRCCASEPPTAASSSREQLPRESDGDRRSRAARRSPAPSASSSRGRRHVRRAAGAGADTLTSPAPSPPPLRRPGSSAGARTTTRSRGGGRTPARRRSTGALRARSCRCRASRANSKQRAMSASAMPWRRCARVDGDLVHVHLVEDPHREQIADDDAAPLRDEVEAPVGGELARRRTRAARRGERRALDAVDGVDVRARGRRRSTSVIRHSASAAASPPPRPAGRRSA